MKIRNLLLFLVLFVSVYAHAQERKALYYTDQWILTTKDSATYFRICFLDTVNTLFEGEVLDYTMDGKLVMRGNYQRVVKDVSGNSADSVKLMEIVGQKNGIFTTYYPSGQLESRGEYKNDERVGLWIFFYANSKPRYEVQFRDNLNFFVTASYDITGKQTIENGTGAWQYFYNPFGEKRRVIIQGSFLNGEKFGDWTCRFSTGEGIYKEVYKNDSLISAEYAGATEADETLFIERNRDKIPPPFKFEVTENFLYKSSLTQLDYPFLLILKKHESQIDSTEMQKKTYLVVEEPPQFKGGEEAVNKFIAKNTQNKIAKKAKVSGTVVVSYVIDIDGTVKNVQVTKSLNKECDAEAIRVISSLPKWKPGKQSGVRVRVLHVSEVLFKP